MSYILGLWILWSLLTVVLLGLILYRISLTQYEEDQLFLDGGNEMQRRDQGEMVAKVKRLEPVIRIFGGMEGLATLAIAAFYVMDALRQF
ncbi:MAG: hypothetical protein ABI164_01970 [Acidobacteriaceae bacterium]